MADLFGVGIHCEYATCHQLDFLPFRCSDCGLTFCKDHRTKLSHACVVPDLPRNFDPEKSTGPDSYTCSAVTCQLREHVRVECATCQLNFCFAHRHAEDHNCTGLACHDDGSLSPKPLQDLQLPATLIPPVQPPKPRKGLSCRWFLSTP